MLPTQPHTTPPAPALARRSRVTAAHQQLRAYSGGHSDAAAPHELLLPLLLEELSDATALRARAVRGNRTAACVCSVPALPRPPPGPAQVPQAAGTAPAVGAPGSGGQVALVFSCCGQIGAP